jgi:hypothetical protein
MLSLGKDTSVTPGPPLRIALLAVAILGAAITGAASCQGLHRHAADPCRPELMPLAGQQVRGCLTAVDQHSDGTSVTVSTVEIRGAPGWIVLHTDDGGEPGPRIGLVHIPQGRSTEVTIPAHERLATGSYWPMLHLDAGAVDAYEFPTGPDVPVVDSQGMVMKHIHITVH